MSDANRQGPGEGAAAEPNVPQSRYEVVPAAQTANDADLYAFRVDLAPPPAPPPPRITPTQAVLQQNKTVIMAVAGGAALVFVVLLIVWFVQRQDPPPAYIDLGTSHIAAAGLEGRLVVRWLGSAEYELHIDTTSPQQLAGFSAVADRPPHPLSVNIRLKDSSNGVPCQKEILIPFNQQPESDPDHPDTVLPQKTSAGDTVQNVADADGKIDEIVATGPLDCPEKLYKRLEAWDFLSNFPLLADQGDWLRHQEGIVAGDRRRTAEMRARALVPKARLLTAPIEGDDVIVSDNPSRGSVETRDGRVFYLGKDALLQAGYGWQVFPAAIHFRCDLKSACVLTRSGASSALQARLVH
jgi:hypothetical protein